MPTCVCFLLFTKLAVFVYERHCSAVVTTLAGDMAAAAAGTISSAWADGNGTNAKFSAPSSITIDQHLRLYVADMINRRIRTIEAGGIMSARSVHLLHPSVCLVFGLSA